MEEQLTENIRVMESQLSAIQFFGVAFWHLIMMILMIYLVYYFTRPVRKSIMDTAERVVEKTPQKWDDWLLNVFKQNRRLVLFIALVSSAYLLSLIVKDFSEVIKRCDYILVTIFVVKCIFVVIDRYFVTSAEKSFGRRKYNYYIFASLGKYITVFFGVFIVLNVFGLSLEDILKIDISQTAIVAMSAIVFAPIATNLKGAWMLAVTHPFAEGDYVQVGDQSGMFKGANVSVTRLKGHSGEIITISNSKISSDPIINYGTRCSMRFEHNYFLDVSMEAGALATLICNIREIVVQKEKCDIIRCDFADGVIGYHTLRIIYQVNDINGENVDQAKNAVHCLIVGEIIKMGKFYSANRRIDL